MDSSVNETQPRAGVTVETADEASDLVAGQPPCQWCATGNASQILDDDGTLSSVSGNQGILSHAAGEYWWPCVQLGMAYKEPMAWQPIEAAPETGRSFLVHCTGRANTYVVYRRSPDTAFYHFGGGERLDEIPTHWMPLPDAPRTQDTGTSEASDKP